MPTSSIGTAPTPGPNSSEDAMRKRTRVSVLSAAAVLVAACGKAGSHDAVSADIQRDLKLASTAPAQGMRINTDELGKASQTDPSVKLKKASGPKVIRTEKPTVKASARQVAAADV